jgi:hypothetical protein
MMTEDDLDDDASTDVRWHEPQARPATHARNAIARGTAGPPTSAAALDAHGHPTERLQRIEQIRLVSSCMREDEPAADCEEETRVAPEIGADEVSARIPVVAAPVSAPILVVEPAEPVTTPIPVVEAPEAVTTPIPVAATWSPPPRRPLPMPDPPHAVAPRPVTLPPEPAPRRRGRLAALVLALTLAGGLAGYELADRTGYAITDIAP